jgi:hypothetical protein
MKKWITIGWSKQNDKFSLQITEQSHRNKEFGDGGKNKFYPPHISNLILQSASMPELSVSSLSQKIFYVRGYTFDYDSIVLQPINEEVLKNVIKSINAYNIYFESPNIQFEFADCTKKLYEFKIELPKDLFKI